MSNWIFVVTDQSVDGQKYEAFKIFQNRVDTNTWGLNYRTPNFNRLRKGDKVVFYLSSGGSHLLVGSAILSSAPRNIAQADKQRMLASSPSYTHVVSISNVEKFKSPKQIEAVIGDLGFVVNKANWGTYFQGGIVGLPDQDYQTIITLGSRELEASIKAPSEESTRKEKIDILLKQAGWDVSDQTRVVLEVDTKQSDFKRRNYRTVSETLKNEEDSQYADYLLLDSNGEPLAIIEAKRTSKDPLSGQKQAEDYADDITKQTAKDIFIFLTNGYEVWFWNRPFEGPRMVKGFHSQDSLERIRFQNNSKQRFQDVAIKQEIVDRPYQIEAVKRVLEGIEKGKRKFLIVQATGTGKTRVAMALIDVLLRSNRAQKILFLADRKALRDQAYNEGFKVFFPNESKTKVYSGKVEKTPRLYCSTIQTFMECYQEFSIGDFDVIISDESHRSIYNKWRDVFTYYDAVQIGLTATPAELIERDTFRFFDCHNKIPTTLYTYEEAIEDKVLVPFRVYKTNTHFQIAGVKPQDVPNQVMKELLEKGIEPEEVDFEGTDIEKKVIVIGTNEAIVKEFIENCITDSTGTLPAKNQYSSP